MSEPGQSPCQDRVVAVLLAAGSDPNAATLPGAEPAASCAMCAARPRRHCTALQRSQAMLRSGRSSKQGRPRGAGRVRRHATELGELAPQACCSSADALLRRLQDQSCGRLDWGSRQRARGHGPASARHSDGGEKVARLSRRRSRCASSRPLCPCAWERRQVIPAPAAGV
jgi:hypothetical protein